MKEARLWKEAQAEYLRGNANRVLQLAEAALEQKPHSYVAWSIKGFALSELQLPGELECYEEMIRLRPNFAEGYYSKANLFHGDGRLARALPLYRKAIKLLKRGRDEHFSQELFHAYAECLKEDGNLVESLRVLDVGVKHPAVFHDELLRELRNRIVEAMRGRSRKDCR